MRLEVVTNHPECEECDLCNQGSGIPAHVGIGTRCTPPLTDGRPELWYVGRNPGYNEDREGNPFIGRSGQLLKGAYIRGINAEDRCNLHLTNGVRCYTVKDEPPKARHWKACLRYLHSELAAEATDRTALVLLGGDCTAHVYRYLFGKKGMNLTKGINENGGEHQLLETDKLVTVFSTYHPSAVLRDPNYINAVHDHNALISDWIDGIVSRPSEPIIVPTRSPL